MCYRQAVSPMFQLVSWRARCKVKYGDDCAVQFIGASSMNNLQGKEIDTLDDSFLVYLSSKYLVGYTRLGRPICQHSRFPLIFFMHFRSVKAAPVSARFR